MTTPLGTLDVLERDARRVRVTRRTRETEVTIALDLDGTGRADVSTGIGFYDHLLSSLAHHGLFDLEVRATGDLHVDEHHTVEDVPYAVIDLPFRGERAGALPLQLVDHALEAFARTAGATLHVRGSGRNDHHLAEAAFKALGRALREACEPDPRRTGVASTKGSLG